MKAKTQFLKMFYKLPEEARPNLVFDAYGNKPMTLAVIAAEVRADTKLSKEIIKKLGYEDVFSVTKRGKGLLKDLGYSDNQ